VVTGRVVRVRSFQFSQDTDRKDMVVRQTENGMPCQAENGIAVITTKHRDLGFCADAGTTSGLDGVGISKQISSDVDE